VDGGIFCAILEQWHISIINYSMIHPNKKTLLKRASEGLIRPLLRWYRGQSRDLPWRRVRDPYAIWISETMLQQTQVKTVIPYWRRWMRELPSIEDLAHATEPQLLKLWEGLGYYARVRHLRQASQEILRQHQGQFPRRFQDVIALPGIGPYTAGAICSIAYNQPTPVVDGNVRRVLSRLFVVAGDVRSSTHRRRMEAWARDLMQLVNDGRSGEHNPCGDWNQALMELGALVCTPISPKCDLCPLDNYCIAFHNNSIGKFPQPAVHRAIKPQASWIFVIRHNNRCLVRQRPTGEVNAGLWEFPNALQEPESRREDALVTSALGFTPAWVEPVMSMVHTITHHRYHCRVFHGEVVNSPPLPGTGEQWLTLAAIKRLPFSAAHRKIVDRVLPQALVQ
jgi:A/G-specific adenine glycosylase